MNVLRRGSVLVLLSSLVAAAFGCYERTNRPLDCADGGCADSGTETGEWCTFAELSGAPIRRADVLFVVDNTGSMAEEQEVLSRQVELMIEQLIDPIGSGPGTAPPVDDLHIGVVSTDMGTHGHVIMTCDNSIDGDNGVLQNVGQLEGCQPAYSAPDCTRAECPWLSHSPEWPDVGDDPSNPPIWEDFGCISILGTGGCGFEQQLESAYIALVRQTGAGRVNEGFLRDDAVLAVVFVTDEDDCSTPNGEMFNPENDTYGHLNVRCATNPDELHPLSRYYDGFRDLRAGNEDLVVVAGIVGVPIDGSWNPGDPIERLREMQVVNPANPHEMLPSCQTGMGLAWPPVRIAELTYMFGENGVLASICQGDWTGAFTAITHAIQRRLDGSCVARDVGSVDAERCRLIETLPDERPCAHPADVPTAERTRGWHVDLGLDEAGRRRCEVLPADYDDDGCPDGSCDCASWRFSGCLQGWFHIPDAPPCETGRLQLTSPEIIGAESRAHFECHAESCR